MKQSELVLFGSAAPVAANIAKAVSITPRYVYQKVKDDNGKWVVVKDKAGNPVPAKDNDGNLIIASESIGLLPRSSDEKADLKDATGLSGQGLMQFEREVRDAMCDAAIAEIVRLRASGQYTFARETRNKRNGAIQLTVKPVFGGKSVTTSTDDELAREMERRGFKVEKNPASTNGKPDDDQGEIELTTAPAKPKAAKKAAAVAALA